MNIDLDDNQKKLLLEILAMYFQVQYMKGEDNEKTGKIIESFADSLKKEGKEDIFFSVFQEATP